MSIVGRPWASNWRLHGGAPHQRRQVGRAGIPWPALVARTSSSASSRQRLGRPPARCCPRTASCRHTGCGPYRNPHEPAVPPGNEGQAERRRVRTTARRVDIRPVRRQLQLARPGLDADQLHDHRVALAVDTFLGDDFRVEYPTGSGTEVRLRDVAEDIARRLHVRIWQDDSWDAAPYSSTYEKFPDRSGLARLVVVPRVLPRRHGSRHRRLRTRPAGRASWPTCSARNGIIDAIDSGR